MLTIYHSFHKKRNDESDFFGTFQTAFPDAIITNDNFRVESRYLNCFVEKEMLSKWLSEDDLLPRTRRRYCLENLRHCPDRLKVCLDSTRILFDIVVVHDDRKYFWEFHESQHCRLTDNRDSRVYAPDGSKFVIPRYLQRLIRDVWRAQYFTPYTIVWSDWFANNRGNYRPVLLDGFNEFCINGRFSFRSFCQF